MPMPWRCKCGLHSWRYYRGSDGMVWKRCTRFGCNTLRWAQKPQR